MYKVSDLAEEFNVTAQTIYNHINQNKFELKGHIKKEGRTQFIDEEGKEIIKKSLGLIEDDEENLSLTDTVNLISESMIKEYADNTDRLISTLVNDIKNDNKDISTSILEETKEIKSALLFKDEKIIKLKEELLEKDKIIQNLNSKIDEKDEIIAEKDKEMLKIIKEIKSDMEDEKNKGFFDRLFK